ncbi:MAG: peptidylprolyl isomerase [Candidatus Methanofastidiosa archaeon]|jgi:peptidylprolyl isomerase|nr:peptidylprolyl isomerase [Candidatus Methanofastidiosa archaeon]MDD4280846.1 peptidylprolyl isomerase [Candidatus Methanofastidiosa archaeon]
MAVRFGDTIQVHYTGTLKDGSVFDSSREAEPIQFTVGDGSILPAFDKEVRGMEVGDTKTFQIPAEDAYGVYNETFVKTVPRSIVPEGVVLEEGMPVLVGETEEDAIQFFVKEMTEDSVVLDGNHPLAGEDLTFAIEVMAIVKQSPSVL